jgi:hypothetical protein
MVKNFAFEQHNPKTYNNVNEFKITPQVQSVG